MRTIEDYIEYLRSEGIEVLTSEACGVSMRVLCDVNEKGQELLNSALSMNTYAYGWNNQDAHSVMLFREMLLPLVIFSLLRDYPYVVYVPSGEFHREQVIAYDTEEEFTESKARLSRITDNRLHVYWRSGTASGGLRNRHEWSGRVE